jgi:endonuclease/exonuclease/phosphatase family metal-dependent hydrolase
MELLHLPSLEPRGAVLADLSVNGAALRVVGMHLDLSGLWRRRQAAAILQHLDRRPGDPATVLMGDLNEWSVKGGCLRDFAHDHQIVTCGRSFHSRRPIAMLDGSSSTRDWRWWRAAPTSARPRAGRAITCRSGRG